MHVETDREFGRAMPALGWVPAPRFLLRRAVVLEALRDATPGKILEIGSGAGSLLADLAARGFSADAVETSDAARGLATRMLADCPTVQVHATIPAHGGPYDFLFAFEVLEHIEDDRAALAEWVRQLRPGARVLLSVPAYAKKWTATDTWAGHFRRYDRADLVRLAESVGIDVCRCLHYGFPLADAIEPINAWVHARALRRQATRETRTAESGVRRSAETRLYPLMRSWPGRLAMRSGIALQRRFPGVGNGLLLDGAFNG